MKIKGLYVGKLTDQTLTYISCKQKNAKLKEDLQKIPGKIRALKSKPGQRNKLKTQYGPWYVLHQNDWGYAVCVNDQYPQRHAYGFIQKIRQFVNNNKKNSSGKFMKQLKNVIDQNSQKYNDLAKIDKVHQAQNQVNMLQDQLHVGINKLMQGQQNLCQLDQRALQMKSFAQEFQHKSSQVQSITFWHKWKFIMLIGLVILGMISLVAVTIMIKY